MQYYKIILYILFGILPSLVWLFYYLRKDLHPEPKRMILKIFLLGAGVTIPVFFIQVWLSRILDYLKLSGFFDGAPIVGDLIKWFVVIALTEEILKYLVVRTAILKSPELDEPLDLMLYMVVAALGFAALENILYLFSPIDTISLQAVLKTAATLSFIRFIGATFLHTLCSALVGYFLALSSLRSHRTKIMVGVGILLAGLLHGLYDFSIMALSRPLNVAVPVTVIAGLAIFMLYDFNEIKKVKSICKI